MLPAAFLTNVAACVELKADVCEAADVSFQLCVCVCACAQNVECNVIVTVNRSDSLGSPSWNLWCESSIIFEDISDTTNSRGAAVACVQASLFFDCAFCLEALYRTTLRREALKYQLTHGVNNKDSHVFEIRLCDDRGVLVYLRHVPEHKVSMRWRKRTRFVDTIL